MNKYLLHGKLTALQGHRDELAAILLQASKLVATANGCKLYVIGLDNSDKIQCLLLKYGRIKKTTTTL